MVCLNFAAILDGEFGIYLYGLWWHNVYNHIKSSLYAGREEELIGEGYIKIFMPESLKHSLLRQNKRIIGRKSFGILVGRRERHDQSIFVYIEDIMPVGKLEGVRDTLTDIRWIDIKTRLIKRFPNQQILGWYGVRTGWNAMMMEEDQFIHQSFFADPFQVMCLLDDKADDLSFYIWEAGRLRRYNGCGLYSKAKGQQKDIKHTYYAKWIIVLISVASLVYFLYPKYMDFKTNRISYNGNETQKIDTDKEKEYGETKENDEILALKKTIGDLEDALEHREQEIKTMEVKLQDSTNLKEEKIYKVQAGDTLSDLSRKFYGHSRYGEALGKINRIADHKTLQVGSYLIIPTQETIEKVHVGIKKDKD